jgi:hypothetical protein
VLALFEKHYADYGLTWPVSSCKSDIRSRCIPRPCG